MTMTTTETRPGTDAPATDVTSTGWPVWLTSGDHKVLGTLHFGSR